MSGILTGALSLCASNVYAQTSYWACFYVRISLVLPDSGCFEEMRTEKAGLSRVIVYVLDAYIGVVAVKDGAGEQESQECANWTGRGREGLGEGRFFNKLRKKHGILLKKLGDKDFLFIFAP